MSTYAADTSVSPEKSRAEIERTVARYGAGSFAYGWDSEHGMAVVGFKMNGRQIRFTLRIPSVDDPAFHKTPTGRVRTRVQRETEQGKAERQRWRALALVVKAKLEAVESGIVTFEEEFAMHMVLPSGRTVAEEVLPAIEEAYATGEVRPLLQIEAAS